MLPASLSGSISRRSENTGMRSPVSGGFFLSKMSQPVSDRASRGTASRMREIVIMTLFALGRTVIREHRLGALLGTLRRGGILDDRRPQLAGTLEIVLARRR